MSLNPHIEALCDILVEVLVREYQNEERPVVVDQALAGSLEIDEEKHEVV